MDKKLKLQNKLAVALGKLVVALKGGQSTSAPGLLASKFAPNLLADLLRQSTHSPILVTGTNGKSTTAGILASILELHFKSKLIHNLSGANLLSGLLTTLLKHSSFAGELKDKPILFETDEAVIRKLTSFKPADLVLVSNFFRDQLDRFGEMEQVISLVQEGLNLSKNGQLVLNADDPNVCKLVLQNQDKPKITFGLDPEIWQSNSIPLIFSGELGICPNCKADLSYKKQWLGQFGDFFCNSCGYKKPEAQVVLKELVSNHEFSKMKITTSSSLPLASSGQEFECELNLPGLFNVYNALGAIAAALALGVSPQNISEGVKSYKPLFGRSQEVVYKNKKLKIFLIKNPIGASEVLRLIYQDPKAKILLAINDNYADGRDVCWLWDAHFEYLAASKQAIVCTGKRASDIAVRLKYAGVQKITFMDNLKESLTELCESAEPDSNFYVIPTYTALIALTKILKITY